MAVPTIVNFSSDDSLNGYLLTEGISIPVTAAGNGLILVMQDSSGTAGPIATSVTSNSGPSTSDIDNFTLVAGSRDTYGAEIWYCSQGLGGANRVNWNGPRTATVALYEISGSITLETAAVADWGGISPNAQGTNHTNVPGPTFTPTHDVIIVTSGLGNPGGQGVNSPWTKDDNRAGGHSTAGHITALASSGSYQPTYARTFNFDQWAFTAASFYSTPLATGTITVHKVTHPSGSSQAFNFVASWGESFTLHDGESHVSPPLLPGSYSVAETPVSNWLEQASQDPTALVVIAATNLDVVFTNTTPLPRGAGCDVPRSRNAFLLIEKSPQSNQTYQMKAVNYDDNYYAHDGDFDLTGTGGFVTGGEGDGSSFGFGTSFGLFGG